MFLQYQTCVMMMCLWGPAAHGLWNLTKNAVQEAGFMGILYHTQTLVNWRAAFGSPRYCRGRLSRSRTTVLIW